MCTEITNLFLPTSFCGSFQFKECYQTSKTKVILGERKMLLDRQILTLDGIATELPYYQYMYVDVCSEAGLSWWPAATGCEPSREHSLLARVFCLRIMNF